MGGKFYHLPGGPLERSTPEGTFDSEGNKITNAYGEFETGAGANEQAYLREKAALGEPVGSWADMDYRGKEAARLAGVNPDGTPLSQDSAPVAQTTPGVGPSKSNETINKGNGFNSSNLYNAGNYIGAINDIYRGSDIDPVNYERVTPELVKPKFVNYEDSRNLNRRDINEGFRNTQDQLRNSGMGSAGFLSALTSTAGARDRAISDSTAKSFENEKNANTTIYNNADATNVGAKNQGKYFNAQTQRAEADARQMEKDVAGNTKSTGLYNLGMAIAQTGSDREYTKQDDIAIEAIRSKYLGNGWSWDKKNNGYKHISGKTKTMKETLDSKPE